VAIVRILSIFGFLIFFSCLVCAQADAPDAILWFHPNQEVRVNSLPAVTAASADPSAALRAALETVIHDKTLCCGRGSAMGESELAGMTSLKELSAKLQGRHFSRDSRTVVVTADYVPQSSINSGLIIGALLDQHAPLIEWKSHVYVLYGAIFNETRFTSGMRQYAILKLLLLDTRFSDQRRETAFNRETDDWELVQGLLKVAVEPQ